MSSPYAVLGGRSLDQWKVTELKEELKKRKLTIKGLKEDLVKRLDEAVRIEWDESAKEDEDNGLSSASQSELPSKQEITEPVVSERAKDLMDIEIGSMEKGDGKPHDELDSQRGSLIDCQVAEVQEKNISRSEGEQDANLPSSQTTVVVTEMVETLTTLSGSQLDNDGINNVRSLAAGLENDISEPPQEDAKHELADPVTEPPEINQTSVVPPSEPHSMDSGTQNELVGSTVHLANDVSKDLLQSNSEVVPLEHQVPKADLDLRFEVVSDSVSTETVPIIEKNDLKVDVITDDVKLEVRHETMQPPPGSVDPDGGESHPMDAEELDTKDVEEPLENKVSMERIGVDMVENVDGLKNIDNGDMGPHEKLSLDRSSGDDSMEEDLLESKQMHHKSNSNENIDNMEKFETPIMKEESDVDVVGVDKPVETKVASDENKSGPGLQSGKRKFHDKEVVGDNDSTKKTRRLNTEGLKGSESESRNVVASTTPKDSSQTSFKRFSRSDSVVNEEAPKERVVPPSSKPPTNSLRIDQFLRPFTLKAVQELLGKTGSVTSFWMDQIKTHCYVSYSSIEEAIETRNAVYNLQWPPNGGRLLVAEFADPQEVKTRVEPPPATPSSSAAPPPPIGQPQPSSRQQLLRQQLPPPSLPPPPPPAREHLPVRERLNLPPPPPLPEKVEPPIVTLDDLFRKTKATPRIYYLPLSDEQVTEKLKSQKNVNQ